MNLRPSSDDWKASHLAALRVRQARHSTEAVVPLLTPEQAAILALLDRVVALEKRVEALMAGGRNG